MKKLQLLILILASVLLLQSCAGIGDGALVGGGGYSPIKRDDHADTTAVADTIAKVENVQTTQKEALLKPSVIALLGEIKSCKISLNAGENPQHIRTFDGDEAEEIYRLFSQAKYESSGGNIPSIKNVHIQVHFTDINGGYETFIVNTKNIYAKEFFSTSYASGKIDGLYNALHGYLE